METQAILILGAGNRLRPEQLQFVARDPAWTTSHIVKYHWSVHIVTRKHLREAMQIVEGVRWHNFAEVRLMFRDADYINGYVVFNIRRNRYRLITVIHYV